MFFVFETAMSSSPEQMQPEIKAVLAPDKIHMIELGS